MFAEIQLASGFIMVLGWFTKPILQWFYHIFNPNLQIRIDCKGVNKSLSQFKGVTHVQIKYELTVHEKSLLQLYWFKNCV